jgi:hypothetical protein
MALYGTLCPTGSLSIGAAWLPCEPGRSLNGELSGLRNEQFAVNYSVLAEN